MPAGKYTEGDHLLIRDARKAAQRIAMPADVEEGMVVEVHQARGELLVCEPADLDREDEITVKPIPESAGTSFTLQPTSADGKQNDSRIVEDDVAAEVSDYLSSSRDVESGTRR